MSASAQRRRLYEEDMRDAERVIARRPQPSAAIYVPPTTFHCVGCRQDKEGRFTKHKFASGGGWSQGSHIPCWYCWTCLPLGQGRDEAEQVNP